MFFERKKGNGQLCGNHSIVFGFFNDFPAMQNLFYLKKKKKKNKKEPPAPVTIRLDLISTVCGEIFYGELC
jgi:hypothetical protein